MKYIPIVLSSPRFQVSVIFPLFSTNSSRVRPSYPLCLAAPISLSLAAYETLSDEGKRAEYDRMLASGFTDENSDEWNEYKQKQYYDFHRAYAKFESTDLSEEAATISLLMYAIIVALCGLPVVLLGKASVDRKANQKKALLSNVKQTEGDAQREKVIEQERAAMQKRMEKQKAAAQAKKLKNNRFSGSENQYERKARQSGKSILNAKPTTVRDRLAPCVTKNKKEWAVEEMSLLAKAMAKYPGGTPDRWILITEEVNTQCSHDVPRGWKDVAATAKKLERREYAAKVKKKATTATSITKLKSTPSTVTADTVSASSKSNDVQEDVWSAEQQTALEQALKCHPGASYTDKKQRWQDIAKDVLGKNTKQCIQRYKLIRQQVLAHQNK
jgi:curved DNA-binding protein CbpA